MAVEDERAPLGAAGAMAADDIEGVVVGDMHRREAGHMANLIDVDPPAVDGEAALAQGGRHEILCRVLGAAHRGEFDELGGQRHLIIEAGIDRLHDGRREIGVEHGASGKSHVHKRVCGTSGRRLN